MMDVMAKVDSAIDIIDKDDTVTRMKELNSLINSDSLIQELRHNFAELKEKYNDDSIITSELTEAKQTLYNHPVVAEYRILYSQLNFYLIKFNKNISSLLDTKNHPCDVNSSKM